jgi:hypothetical protein
MLEAFTVEKKRKEKKIKMMTWLIDAVWITKKKKMS